MSRKQELIVSVNKCYNLLKGHETAGIVCIFTKFLILPLGIDFHVKPVSAMEEGIESMHVESAPDNQSGAAGPFPPLPTDTKTHVDSFAMDSHSPTSYIVEPAPWRCTNSYAYL